MCFRSDWKYGPSSPSFPGPTSLERQYPYSVWPSEAAKRTLIEFESSPFERAQQVVHRALDVSRLHPPSRERSFERGTGERDEPDQCPRFEGPIPRRACARGDD